MYRFYQKAIQSISLLTLDVTFVIFQIYLTDFQWMKHMSFQYFSTLSNEIGEQGLKSMLLYNYALYIMRSEKLYVKILHLFYTFYNYSGNVYHFFSYHNSSTTVDIFLNMKPFLWIAFRLKRFKGHLKILHNKLNNQSFQCNRLSEITKYLFIMRIHDSFVL